VDGGSAFQVDWKYWGNPLKIPGYRPMSTKLTVAKFHCGAMLEFIKFWQEHY
jgi:hypothetical protein